MVDFDFEENCSGCNGCYNVCPVSAIRMKRNIYGFMVPEIDLEKCILCGRCEKVCPHLTAKLNKDSEYINVKAAWLYTSQNDEAKWRSSSGAAWYDLGKAAIKAHGIISGCIWDDELRAVHVVGCDEKLLIRTQGSKYVQSDIGKCYVKIADYLKSDRFVIFSGTPCQATAIHNYVMTMDKGKKYREKLITVAVICHGVASPLAWESYKKWNSEREGSLLVKVNFRDKLMEGYKKSYCRYEYQSGDVKYLSTSKYIEATLIYNLGMRNSCTKCDCKGVNIGCDLVIGDWLDESIGGGETRQVMYSCIFR